MSLSIRGIECDTQTMLKMSWTSARRRFYKYAYSGNLENQAFFQDTAQTLRIIWTYSIDLEKHTYVYPRMGGQDPSTMYTVKT